MHLATHFERGGGSCTDGRSLQANPDGVAPLSVQPSVSFTPSKSSKGSVVTVNPAVRYQQMDGFGAAMTDSSACLIHSLPTTERTKLMNWFFNKTSGLGLDFIRQPKGATDFSAQGHFS
jgi:glucosylceramidase